MRYKKEGSGDENYSNITISMEKIPEMINDLQEIYSEYQKAKKELKKQGKLENISKEDSESEEEKYIKNFKRQSKEIAKLIKSFSEQNKNFHL
jgi:Sec-independent protein translocase protein TatA